MKTTINSLPQSKKEILIHLDKNDVLPFKKIALQELNKTLKVDGYRTGKAPLSVAENNLPALEVYEKAASLAIQKLYPQVVQKNKISAIGYPYINITKIIPDQEVELKAEISVLPEISLPDYKKIAQEMHADKKDVSVGEKEIEEALSFIQSSRATLKPVKRAAQNEDVVTIDYQIREKENLIPDGEDKDHTFILGKGHFMPGWEENIVGMKQEENKKFSITVPDSWKQEDLRGKKLTVEINLKEVKEKKLPSLDDAFAQKLGDFKGLKELKENITRGLQMEKEDKEKERWRLQILNKIISESKIELPEILINVETEKMVEELKAQLEKMQLDFPQYLQQIKKSEEELRNDLRETARQRVYSSLILREIGILEKIQVSEEEIKEKISEILKQIPDAKMKEKINPENLKEFASGIIRNEKVFQILEK